MPYVQGEGFRMGLALSESMNRHKREKAYQEDRARAMAQAQADLEADIGRLDEAEDKEAARIRGVPEHELTGAAEDSDSPFSVEEQRVHERFARVRAVAQRMSPEHRMRWLEEEKVRMQDAALTRARKKVAEGIQDRYQRGGFNFLDETEVNPAVDARVDELMQGLDSNQIDPIKAAELEATILEAVRKENERRLQQKRGLQMIEKELGRALETGNQNYAANLEALHAMWGTGELKPDDLIDKMFEAQYGRKTARASAPNPFDVRKEATRLWEKYETGPPTEEGLQKYIDLLVPPERAPEQRFGPLQAFKGTAGSKKGIGYSHEFEEPKAEGGRRKNVPEPRAEELAQFQKSARERSGKAAPPEQGGLPPRAWAKLKPVEQKQAEKDLIATARKGGNMRQALAGIGISDPNSLPVDLVKKLIELAKRSKKGPTMGETLARLRPGAGGM